MNIRVDGNVWNGLVWAVDPGCNLESIPANPWIMDFWDCLGIDPGIVAGDCTGIAMDCRYVCRVMHVHDTWLDGWA